LIAIVATALTELLDETGVKGVKAIVGRQAPEVNLREPTWQLAKPLSLAGSGRPERKNRSLDRRAHRPKLGPDAHIAVLLTAGLATGCLVVSSHAVLGAGRCQPKSGRMAC